MRSWTHFSLGSLQNSSLRPHLKLRKEKCTKHHELWCLKESHISVLYSLCFKAFYCITVCLNCSLHLSSNYFTDTTWSQTFYEHTSIWKIYMKTEPDSYIFYLNIQRIKNNEAHFVSTMYFKLKTFLTTVRCDSYCLHIKKKYSKRLSDRQIFLTQHHSNSVVPQTPVFCSWSLFPVWTF